MFNAKITGFAEVDKVLAGLEPKLSKKILRGAMRDGIKIMLTRARALAPVGPSRQLKSKGHFHTGGLLRKKIKIKSSRSRKGIRIAIMVGEKDFTGDAWYGAVQEYGGGGKGKGPRGPIKAKHFLKQAFDETNDAVRETTFSSVLSRLDEITTPGG
jgi:HK97 gp10 family phage protein